jgi:uncharacterized protein
MSWRKIILAAVLSGFFLSGALSWGQPQGKIDVGGLDNAQPAVDVATKAIDFFSHHPSTIDGARCPMYPTCSQYSREAFQKHGVFDRLADDL